MTILETVLMDDEKVQRLMEVLEEFGLVVHEFRNRERGGFKFVYVVEGG